MSKSLILPVGLDRARMWKSVVRSGADTIYLVHDSKKAYRITRETAEDFGKQIRNLLQGAPIIQAADFSNSEDIYRKFVGIIETELRRESAPAILLDLTSTTKMATIVAVNLATLYGVELTYVPASHEEANDTEVMKRFDQSKDEPGGEYQHLVLLTVGERSLGFSGDDKRILQEIAEADGFGSINEMIERLRLKDQIPFDEMVAYKKRIFREVQRLQEHGLVNVETKGRRKPLDLTEPGRRIVGGMKYGSELQASLRKESHVKELRASK